MRLALALVTIMAAVALFTATALAATRPNPMNGLTHNHVTRAHPNPMNGLRARPNPHNFVRPPALAT
jgi:hypothetical protein